MVNDMRVEPWEGEGVPCGRINLAQRLCLGVNLDACMQTNLGMCKREMTVYVIWYKLLVIFASA